MKARSLLAGGILAASLAVAGVALAQPLTVSGSFGPVAVPNVPVQLCVDSTCQQTPALSSVGLVATATADSNAVLPSIDPGTCASGLGGTLVIKGGSIGATVAATLFGTLPTGSSFSQPVGPVTVAPNATVTVSACAEASGLPVPALTSLLTGVVPAGLPI